MAQPMESLAPAGAVMLSEHFCNLADFGALLVGRDVDRRLFLAGTATSTE